MMAVDLRSFPFGARTLRRVRPGPCGVLVALAVGAACLAGCNRAQPPRASKTPRVVVTTPVSSQVIDYQDFTGRLDAFRSVEVKARVTGHITAAPFSEGDVVTEGQLLFQIDPRPYQADLNQAE